MKKLTLLIAVFAVAAMAPHLAAQTIARANVPFEFQVMGHVLPAGEYTVARLSMTDYRPIRITGPEASSYLATAIVGNRTHAKPGTVELVFHRYGNQYFLADIEDGYRDASFTLPMSTQERELASASSPNGLETVALLIQR